MLSHLRPFFTGGRTSDVPYGDGKGCWSLAIGEPVGIGGQGLLAQPALREHGDHELEEASASPERDGGGAVVFGLRVVRQTPESVGAPQGGLLVSEVV